MYNGSETITPQSHPSASGCQDSAISMVRIVMGRETKGQTFQPKAESDKSKPSPPTLSSLVVAPQPGSGSAKPSKTGTTPTAQGKGHSLLLNNRNREFQEGET